MSGNVRRSRRSEGAPSTSWQSVSRWYDGWVGQEGSHYHRALAIPAVLDLLAPRPGEDILDVGAGQGVLAPHVARAGARYTGVDASPHLIEVARRRHGADGRFLVGDARGLAGSHVLRGRAFDAGVFLLSIQDMDPLAQILASLDRVLRPTSRVVILMTHPAFRQPRHSGWGYDAVRQVTYRRVDAYLKPMAIPMKAIGTAPPTRSFHRPLSAYVNGLSDVGFGVDRMLELPDLPGSQRPRARRSETRAEAEIPLFLGLRAKR